MTWQVTMRNNETVLIADAANKEEIDSRVAQIKKELAETDSTYDQEKLSERIAKLAGGVAVIKVPATVHAETMWCCQVTLAVGGVAAAGGVLQGKLASPLTVAQRCACRFGTARSSLVCMTQRRWNVF